MRIKIDLHTHSIISYDGGISVKQYGEILSTKIVDFIAVTDHNETRFARFLQKRFGEQIIIGEEIMSKDGEIIGLFLQETIAPGQSALETMTAIHQQDGIVYIPHPFEHFRKGLQRQTVTDLAEHIDILEVFNGRGRLRSRNKYAEQFATDYKLAPAASSDSHCTRGIGNAYCLVSEAPTGKNLTFLLRHAELNRQYAPWPSLLCPLVNKLKNKLILTNKLENY